MHQPIRTATRLAVLLLMLLLSTIALASATTDAQLRTAMDAATGPIAVEREAPGTAVAVIAEGTRPTTAAGAGVQADAGLARAFETRQLAGVLVLFDPATGTMRASDPVRAATGFLPASTFKVPASIIALDTGVVGDAFGDRFEYDGIPFFNPACNRDLTLAEAVAQSCIPVFARLAREIGDERLNAGLRALGFGNADASGPYPYWLRGNLRISAREQAAFMDRLRRRDLPVARSVLDAAAKIIELEREGDYVLYGKTGWNNPPGAGIGWFVGWAQKGDTLRVFALNLDIRKREDAKARLDIVKAALAAEGIAP